MPRRERMLVLFGGACSAAGLAGLAYSGPSLAMVFSVLKGAVPGIVGKLSCSGGSAALVGLGVLLTSLGLVAQSRGAWLSKWGRCAVAVAGCSLAVGGGLMFYALWRLFGEHNQLAHSAAPSPGEVDRLVHAADWLLGTGFLVGLAGQILLLLAGRSGFWIATDQLQHPLGGAIALPLVNVMAALGFSVLLILATISGADAATLAATASPRASELAGHLVGVVRYGLMAGTLLFLAGTSQALGGMAVPKPRPQSRK